MPGSRHDAAILESLATAGGDPEDASSATRSAAAYACLDSVGVVLGACDHPAARAARHYARDWLSGGDRVSTLWGAEQSTVDGALIANAVALRCYDFNDVLHGAATGQAGHATDTLPGFFAVAEARHSTGRELLSAIIATFDSIAALFDTVNVTTKGWDYANLTGLGAVRGYARLFGLDNSEIQRAFGIYSVIHLSHNEIESGALDSTGNLTMWKRFNGAQAARQAMEACRMALSGVEPPIDSLLGAQGYFAQQGSSEDELALLVDGENGAITDLRGVERSEYKRWPIGTRGQSAVAAALRCRKSLPAAAHIDRVIIEAEHEVISHLVRSTAWEPHTRETADHSLPYIVAAALIYGEVGIDQFSSTSVSAAEVRELLHVTEVVERPTPPGGRSSYPTTVTVVTSEQTVAATSEYPPEQICASAFSTSLREKFDSLAARRLPADQAAELQGMLLSLEDVQDVREIGRYLIGTH